VFPGSSFLGMAHHLCQAITIDEEPYIAAMEE
jgi:hypothetical protein